jgi:hypothetical protein
VVIPQLIFAHLLADYVLQTNWLATRKEEFILQKIYSWDGLLLHGAMVWLMSLAVLPRFIGELWPYVTVLTLLHIVQDAAKVWIKTHRDIDTLYPYLVDQALHLLAILAFQHVVASRFTLTTDPTEITLAMLGASLVAVTRFYEVSWWANWSDIYPYMDRWRYWGYAERVAMLLLSAIKLWWLAPLAVIPRLYSAQRRDEPIGQQRGGLAELLLGIAFSVILGFAF